MGEYSHVVEQKGWAEIIIDRPERRNALVPPLFSEMTASLKALDQRDDISSIVLRGEGGYFCSGIDLKALQNNPPADWADMPDSLPREVFLLCDRVTSPELLNLGLITECVEDAQVVARCHEIAERLASFPQGATATIKAALVAQRGIDNPEAFFPIQANPGLLTAKMVKN